VPKAEEMYKTGIHLLFYYEDVGQLREHLISVWCLLWTMPSTSWGIVCRRVSTLKADILNITYDCFSQNYNIEMAIL